jgi:hypothetical protein
MLLEVAGGLDFGNENTEVVLFYKGRKVSITLPSAIALGTLEGLSRIRSVAETEVLKDRE